MNMIKCLKKLLIRLHEWVQKKWLIVSVLMSTSSIWFSLILSFWGEKLHFIVTDASGKRQFTFLGGDSYNLSGWIFVFIGNGTKIL